MIGFSKFFAVLAFLSIIVFTYSKLQPVTKNSIEQNTTKQTVDPIQLKKDIEWCMKTAYKTLGDINDTTSAKNAVKVLNKVNIKLKKCESKMYQISTVDRMQIKQYVTDYIPHLGAQLEKNKGNKEITKILDDILEKFEDTLKGYKVLKDYGENF